MGPHPISCLQRHFGQGKVSVLQIFLHPLLSHCRNLAPGIY